MISNRYQQLNPLAVAIAAGCTELVSALVVWWSMAGMTGGYGGVMGGGTTMGGPMMRGPGIGFGYGLIWWLGGALLTALAGAFFAWIYNAINARSAGAGHP
jgi:hypothetical protein